MAKKLVIVSARECKELEAYCKEWPEDILYLTASEDADLTEACAENQEVLVVCWEEAEAAALATRLQLPHEKQAQMICLEGYEGTHYFANCIQSKQRLEDSLMQLIDMLFLPGVVNLDFYDLQSKVQGSECFITSFCDMPSDVNAKVAKFLRENPFRTCMINLFGEFNLGHTIEISELFYRYEDVLIGAIPTDKEQGKTRVMMICCK